jgi:hypothetical protein
MVHLGPCSHMDNFLISNQKNFENLRLVFFFFWMGRCHVSDHGRYGPTATPALPVIEVAAGHTATCPTMAATVRPPLRHRPRLRSRRPCPRNLFNLVGAAPHQQT